MAYQADGLAESGVHLGNQGQAQRIHVGEVAVEAGGHDARGLGHLAQADAAEATAALHEQAGGIQQGLAGL